MDSIIPDTDKIFKTGCRNLRVFLLINLIGKSIFVRIAE